MRNFWCGVSSQVLVRLSDVMGPSSHDGCGGKPATPATLRFSKHRKTSSLSRAGRTTFYVKTRERRISLHVPNSVPPQQQTKHFPVNCEWAVNSICQSPHLTSVHSRFKFGHVMLSQEAGLKCHFVVILSVYPPICAPRVILVIFIFTPCPPQKKTMPDLPSFFFTRLCTSPCWYI